MSKEWTREERKEHLKKKYYSTKKKLFFLGSFFALIFILLYLTFGSLKAGNYFLAALSGVGMVIIVPLVAVFIDTLIFEGE